MNVSTEAASTIGVQTAKSIVSAKRAVCRFEGGPQSAFLPTGSNGGSPADGGVCNAAGRRVGRAGGRACGDGAAAI